jgi:seryl-tRNA synthetase
MTTVGIIQEYRSVTENIAVSKSRLQTVKRELCKNKNAFSPKDAQGIDYSKERVQSSMHQESMIVVVHRIYELIEEQERLERELEELKVQQKELEKTINSLGDIKKQVLMLQIKGYPQYRIARELNYSKRHIERICSEIKKMSV